VWKCLVYYIVYMHLKIWEDCGCEGGCVHHDTVPTYWTTQYGDMVDYSMISVQFVQEGLAKYQERNWSVILSAGSFEVLEVNSNSFNCVSTYHM